MKDPAQLRLAARLARREVRRRPGRTALVAVLVALPVAGMVLALVLFRTDQLSADEEWQGEYGSADAVVFDGGPSSAEPNAGELPAGSHVAVLQEKWTRVRSADGGRSELRGRRRP